MTHKPVVPAASQSPYPLHPAPASHAAAPATEAETPTHGTALSSRNVAIGIGSAAIVAALMWVRRR